MARIVKKENPMRAKHRKRIGLAKVCFCIALLCLVLMVLCWNLPEVATGLLIPVPVFVVIGMAFMTASGSRITAAGMEGEDATARLLSRLPEGYTCYQNLTIAYQGRESELDFLITGPTGVFILEVKHLNGTVRGHYDQSRWQLDKTGRKGGQYQKQFYSPVKQVGTHTWHLAGWLRERKLYTYINSIVYFSHPGSRVQLEGQPDKTPVFSAAGGENKQLLQRILKNDNRLEPKRLHRINAALEEQ